ncbi:hypothetical protein [Nostoc sp.]|uniref:hypothetical protein n=1 Tax=Nostoc sp. TaxID=1180 RepID=UPI002FFB30D5
MRLSNCSVTTVGIALASENQASQNRTPGAIASTNRNPGNSCVSHRHSILKLP